MIIETVDDTCFYTSRVEDATSSLASNTIASTRQDAAIGVEQRVPHASDDSSARDAKIDTNKKIDVKKKVGRLYGKIESQMVSDPSGEVHDSVCYLMQ